VSEKWDNSIKVAFVQKIDEVRSRRETSLEIFSEWTITEYLKRELLIHNNYALDEDKPTGKLEIAALINYFKFVDDLLSKPEHSSFVKDEDGKVDVERTSFPSFIKQFQFTEKTNPVFEMLCCYSFLDVMKKYHEKEVEEYLEEYGVESEWQFATSMMNVINESIPSISTSGFPLFRMSSDSKFSQFFENRIINLEEYGSSPKLQTRFVGMQSRPLYRYDDRHVCVMSWRFLYQNVGMGVLFDFYERKGLVGKYGSLPGFKSRIVSLEVYEKRIFRPLLEAIFDSPYNVLKFDEGENISNMPDCYYRERKRIYLFEFKDMLFSNKIVQSGSYEDIVKLVKRNLVANDSGSPKGIGQIVEQIKKMEESCFRFDDFIEKGLKRKSITIYPVIVYSNKQFAFSGINKLLVEEFNELIEKHGFKHVYKPTLISLDYIFSCMELFSNVPLHEIIKKYHLQVKSRGHKLSKIGNLPLKEWIGSLFKQYNSIEQSRFEFPKKYKKQDTKEDRLIHKVLNNFKVSK
jgi:hypothetical protein